MSQQSRTNLFELILKASPYMAFVFQPVEDSFNLTNVNLKMQTYLDNHGEKDLALKLKDSMNYLHPVAFPLQIGVDQHFLVIMPVIQDPRDGDRLCIIVKNPETVSFEPPLLSEDSWHELNNPLAIISLTLQKIIKKEVLDQQDIDTILEKINSNFTRIESFILAQVELKR